MIYRGKSRLGLYVCLSFFFFQAEDGIRDLVRSRGLGDVYKRQPWYFKELRLIGSNAFGVEEVEGKRQHAIAHYLDSVSYTHLTLPTSDLV